MKTKEEIYDIFKSKISELAYSFPKDVSWKEREMRAKALDKLDFGCKFKCGKCKTQRSLKGKTYNFAAGPKACCSNCVTQHGYLNYINKDNINTYVSSWNPETGFWRKDKGCVLPRELRSDTCLSYNCGSHPRELIISFLKGSLDSMGKFLADFYSK